MTHMEFKNIINELDTDGDKMLDLREVTMILRFQICRLNLQKKNPIFRSHT